MKDFKNSLLIDASIIASDITFIILADLASFFIRFNLPFPSINFDAYLRLIFSIIISRIIGFYAFGLYEKPYQKSNFELFVSIFKGSTISSFFIISFIYFTKIEFYPRSIMILSWFFTITFIAVGRLTNKNIATFFLGEDFLYTNFAIIGSGHKSREAAQNLLLDASSKYRLAGFITTDKNAPFKSYNEKIIGSIEDLPFIIKKYPIDAVILSEQGLDNIALSRITSLMSSAYIPIIPISDAYENLMTSVIRYEHSVHVLSPLAGIKSPAWYLGLKRIFDIIIALITIILSAPILLISVILIKIASPGPILYLQKRTGLNGKPFIIYKLRTMHINAEKGKKPCWAKKDDARITPVGKMLRFCRIDELPQLINVLKNDMSLIGPRPERPYFTYRLMRKIPFYAQRLKVKPGLSGWAQVSYKYTDTEKDAGKKLIYDLFYIQNMSLSLDLLITLKTIKVILIGHGAQ